MNLDNLDDLLKDGLASRAAGGSGDLLTSILRTAEATPQRGPSAWAIPAGNRRLMMVGLVALLLAAAAGAAAIGSAILRPQPRPIPQIRAHANGEVVVHGEGCELVAVDPITRSERALFAGVPDCYGLSRYQLAWAPDGDRLAFGYAFICGGCGSPEAQRALAADIDGLWVLDPSTGVATQLVHCTEYCLPEGVSWSPDGKRIAYRWENAVFAVSVEGGTAVRVSPQSSPASSFAWSPDSAEIAFVAGPGAASDVEVAKIDGSDHRVLFTVQKETIEGVAWSPDGRSIAVSSSGDPGALRVLSADGGSTTTLLELSAGVRPLSPRWSPDGTRIAFSRVTGLPDPDLPEWSSDVDLLVMPASGGEAHVAYHGPWKIGAISDLIWSPDGLLLAFSISRAAPSPDELREAGSGTYVVPSNGDAAAILLTPLAETDALADPIAPPAWQPLPIP